MARGRKFIKGMKTISIPPAKMLCKNAGRLSTPAALAL
jgi:hypothetical protein